MIITDFFSGFSANKINPSWVALKESHGHESYAHKLFMRYTGTQLITFLKLMKKKPRILEIIQI